MPAYSAKLPSYLFQDPRTDTFYLRFRYTEKLALVIGSAEFKRSLRTKDRDSARFLAGYIYRLIKDQLGAVGTMDRKWATVYVKELYQRLLQRGQVALSSDDSLSFNWYTDRDGRVLIPPEPTPQDISESQSLLYGYPYKETFEDFKGWFALQDQLALATTDEARSRLIFDFVQARKVAEGTLAASAEEAEAGIQTGLDRDSNSQVMGKDGHLILGAYNFEQQQAMGLPHSTGTEQQKKILRLQNPGAPISEPEFSKLLFGMQAELFRSLAQFQQQVTDRTADTETVMEKLTDSVLITDAHDVTVQLEAYRDTVRELGLAREMEATGKSEQELMDEGVISEAEYQALLAEDKVASRQTKVSKTVASEPESKPVVPFLKYFDAYYAVREKSVKAASLKKDRSAKKWVMAQYGADWDCNAIDSDDVIEFIDCVMEGRSAVTTNQYIGILNSFFEWLWKNKKINREQGMIFDGRRLKESRSMTRSYRPYPNDEIALILNHRFGKTANGRIDAGRWPKAAYWMPKIAIYTGMRLSEIAELTLADVYPYTDDEWIIAVADKGEEGERNAESNANKTPNAIRLVPMHSKLYAMGFADFARQEQEERGKGFLFHELFDGRKKSPGKSWGDPVSRWFNRYLLPLLEIKEERKTFHSLRSTFLTRLKQRGVDEYIAKQLVGHDKPIYGMTRSLAFEEYAEEARTEYSKLKEVVEAVSYD